MVSVRLALHGDRDKAGSLSLGDEAGRTVSGPCSVAGRASSTLARASRNPKRDALLRYGDTPIGSYRVREILKSGKGTRFSTAEFGSLGVIVLEGISGDAAIAESNGRFHFLIQGGKLAKSGQLRSPAGSLRIANADMRRLIAVLRKNANTACEIVAR